MQYEHLMDINAIKDVNIKKCRLQRIMNLNIGYVMLLAECTNSPDELYFALCKYNARH